MVTRETKTDRQWLTVGKKKSLITSVVYYQLKCVARKQCEQFRSIMGGSIARWGAMGRVLEIPLREKTESTFSISSHNRVVCITIASWWRRRRRRTDQARGAETVQRVEWCAMPCFLSHPSWYDVVRSCYSRSSSTTCNKQRRMEQPAICHLASASLET